MATDQADRKMRYWLGGRREAAQDQFFIEALSPDLWEEGVEDEWDACWYTGMPKPGAFRQREPLSWINHIPGNNRLTIKNQLAETLALMRARMIAENGKDSTAARRLEFFPETFPMPEAYHHLQATAHSRPSARWILKPKNLSRGRDIRLLRDTATIPSDDKWMVQRYLDHPHTINGHKYVLRLYVLITSVEPLCCYLYHEAFAKLASEPYDPSQPFNIFSHLTNPDINATNQSVTSPVVFIPMRDYRAWLRDQGHDDKALFARIDDLVRLTAISAREHMRRRCGNLKTPLRGAYELLGLDCLVDADLKPWILECNLSPSLDVCAAPADGGDDEFVIKRQLVHDMVDMLGFNRPDERASYGDNAEGIGARLDAEMQHRGGWRRLVPSDRPEDDLSFFPFPRLADILAADHVAERRVERPRAMVHRVAEVMGEESLGLYAEETGQLYQLNDTATWIWLKATEGLDPDEIAAEMASLGGATGPEQQAAVRRQVWDQLAEWAEMELVRKRSASSDPASEAVPTFEHDRLPYPITEIPADGRQLCIDLGGRRIGIGFGSRIVAERLLPLFHGTTEESSSDPDLSMTIIAQKAGYGILEGGTLLAEGLSLGSLAPFLRRHLMSLSVEVESAGALQGTVISLPGRENTMSTTIFIPSQGDGPVEGLHIELARNYDATFGWGLRINATGNAVALCLPLGVSDQPHAAAATTPTNESLTWHKWNSGEEGILVPATFGQREKPVTIDAVLLLDDGQPGTSDQTGSLVSADVALTRLLAGFVGPQTSKVPSAERIRALQSWLERRPVLSLPMDGNGAVATGLKSLLAGKQVAEVGT